MNNSYTILHMLLFPSLNAGDWLNGVPSATIQEAPLSRAGDWLNGVPSATIQEAPLSPAGDWLNGATIQEAPLSHAVWGLAEWSPLSHHSGGSSVPCWGLAEWSLNSQPPFMGNRVPLVHLGCFQHDII